MIKDIKLYYTAPNNKIFNELKNTVADFRLELDPEFGQEKANHIMSLTNVRDNFMYVFASLDQWNQKIILDRVSEKTKKAIIDRLPEDYFDYNILDLLFPNLKR